MKSKRAAKGRDTRIFCIATAMKANANDPEHQFRGLARTQPVSVIPVALASSVIRVVTNCMDEPRRDVGEP
jgi:hypothetical protein